MMMCAVSSNYSCCDLMAPYSVKVSMLRITVMIIALWQVHLYLLSFSVLENYRLCAVKVRGCIRHIQLASPA